MFQFQKLISPNFHSHIKTHSQINNILTMGNDHEVEFHEIEIQLFQEVEFLIMRSKFNLFMRSNLSNNIDQEVDTSIMRSKPKIALLAILISWKVPKNSISWIRSHEKTNFDLMKFDLLTLSPNNFKAKQVLVFKF